ncbi:cellulase family glycosylhydrolase [uncultured Draconibacterium sp.]|uniref:glycoside hydrolase family 5 protein n=1 Tax=uncultured Draconibacterium sp. TaxID=1573823 RepID=UPI00321683F1
MHRRKFIKTTGLVSAGVSMAGPLSASKTEITNALPQWRGFNLLDYFTAKGGNSANGSTEEDFKWMADWGFDFVRIPMAYPRYVEFDSSKDITPEDIYNINEREVDRVNNLVDKANKHGLHVSLNLHRAPGFCVNAGFNEPYNLWEDKEAQEAFYFHWGMWAKRFASYSNKQISFDLVNEPCTREDMNDQFSKRGPIPGKLYREVAKTAAERIRTHNPNHLVVADGNNVGSDVIPEIFDLEIGQSCRGYYPHYVSHYRAPWVYENPDDALMPVWPGEIDGKTFSRESIEQFYSKWIDAVKQGVGVHCGECGCWRETPHDVFLSWFEDVISVLAEHNIGYALWNFRGDFGILDSGRKDIEYEDWHGHKLDRKLLQLLQKY